MKTSHLLAASVMACSVLSVASAQTTIKITGSTALRTNTHQAIINLLGGTGNYKAFNGSSATATEAQIRSATIAVYQGNLSSLPVGVTNPVTFQLSFTGSTGGIDTVVNNKTISTWILTSKLPASNGIAGAVLNTTTPSLTDFEAPTLADATIADTNQSATPFPSPVLTKYETGVLPFVWIKNLGAPAAWDNVTNLAARSVLAGGAPLSFFTGNSADTTFVYAVGRDQASGTRTSAFADSGYGALTNPFQFLLNVTSGAITSATATPAATVVGINYDAGTGGYSSGGSIITVFNATGSTSAPVYDVPLADIAGATPVATGAYFLSYVGAADAATLTDHVYNTTTGVYTTNNGADLRVLKHNGVSFSYENVRNGKYTFWTNAFVMHRSTLASARARVAEALAIQTRQVTVPIIESTMKVTRTSEGGLINAK